MERHRHNVTDSFGRTRNPQSGVPYVYGRASNTCLPTSGSFTYSYAGGPNSGECRWGGRDLRRRRIPGEFYVRSTSRFPLPCLCGRRRELLADTCSAGLHHFRSYARRRHARPTSPAAAAAGPAPPCRPQFRPPGRAASLSGRRAPGWLSRAYFRARTGVAYAACLQALNLASGTSRRSSTAWASVPLSTCSSSPPTGRPRAMRVT